MFRPLSRCRDRPGPDRRPRRIEPMLEPIEPRLVLSVTGLTASVSPTILRPIDPSNQPRAVSKQHLLRVTVAADVAVDPGDGTPTVSYRVIDQYGRDQPSGHLALQAISGGLEDFAAQFGLSDLRDPATPGGRHYTVIVTAHDGTSVRQSEAVVTVPPAGFFSRK